MASLCLSSIALGGGKPQAAAIARAQAPKPALPAARPARQMPPVVANQPAPGIANQNGDMKPEDETYVYQGSTRRDPFYSLVTAAKLAEKRKKKAASPLEEYDVYQMKLQAVLRDAASRYALVKLPDGKFFTLKEGSVVGIHGGRVSRIGRSSINVLEILSDVRGKKYSKQTTLKLREEEEQ